MLGLEDLEKRLAECSLAALALAGDRYGFVRAGRRLVLDQVFEVIIVDVVWRTVSLSTLGRDGLAHTMSPFWNRPQAKGVPELHLRLQ